MSLDEEGIPVPKTATGALMSVATYLQATQPLENDPRAALHHQQIKFINMAGAELLPKEPQPAGDAPAGNKTLPRHQRSPRQEPRTRHLSDRVARDQEDRVVWVRNDRAARDQEDRATRDRRNRATRGREDRYRLVEGEDARNAITQSKVNRNHSRRAGRDASSEDSDSEEEFEPCGALCFSQRIREARMPKGFRLTSETPKYDGL